MPRANHMRKRAAGSLARDLAALPDLPFDTLKDRWRMLYGGPPPSRPSRALLVRAIAHRMQEQVVGGLKPVTRRRLARAAEEIAAGKVPGASAATIKPGTLLLREWQGVMHEVIVLEDGMQYRGRTWRSLSAVAREITGARWSGPLFFGLRRTGVTAKESCNGG